MEYVKNKAGQRAGVRQGGLAEAQAVQALAAACYDRVPGIAHWQRELQQPAVELHVLQQPKQIIAYTLCWALPPELELHDIAVTPSCQGQGWGRVLLAWRLQQAREQDMQEVFLEVRCSNAPALAVYQSLGFGVCHRRRHYYGNGEDALVMRCDLTGEKAWTVRM